MEIWIVTVGWYEDRQLVGVALSSDAADMLVMKARLSGRFRGIENFGAGDDCPTYETAGPYAPGTLYDGTGRPL